MMTTNLMTGTDGADEPDVAAVLGELVRTHPEAMKEGVPLFFRAFWPWLRQAVEKREQALYLGRLLLSHGFREEAREVVRDFIAREGIDSGRRSVSLDRWIQIPVWNTRPFADQQGKPRLRDRVLLESPGSPVVRFWDWLERYRTLDRRIGMPDGRPVTADEWAAYWGRRCVLEARGWTGWELERRVFTPLGDPRDQNVRTVPPLCLEDLFSLSSRATRGAPDAATRPTEGQPECGTACHGESPECRAATGSEDRGGAGGHQFPNPGGGLAGWVRRALRAWGW